MFPKSDFTLTVKVNHYLSEPTDIRLDLQNAENHVTMSSVTVRLNGEDVTSVNLIPKTLENKIWIPKYYSYLF